MVDGESHCVLPKMGHSPVCGILFGARLPSNSLKDQNHIRPLPRPTMVFESRLNPEQPLPSSRLEDTQD